jgi:thioredoxin 1
LAGQQTVEVTDATFQAEVFQSKIPVVVDFWAPWCGPCRMMAPAIGELASEYAGRVKVCKLNVDDNQDTARQFDVRSLPTIMFFKSGRQAKRIDGPAPKDELKRQIDAVL